MPPRSAAAQDANSDGIDGFQLPKALVTRIAKSALPHDAKLQKDTVSALVDSSTVFINYLAATAHDVAESRSHKTIAAPDILKALEIIEFGGLVSLLEKELEVYRGILKSDKGKGKAMDTIGKGKEKVMEITDNASEPDKEPVDNTVGQDDPEDDQPEEIPEDGQETIVQDLDEVEEDGLDEDEDMADPEPEEEAEEGEPRPELVDIVEVEAKEVREDAKGVEEREPRVGFEQED